MENGTIQFLQRHEVSRLICHKTLLATLDKELKDARVLKLIGRMLKSKVVMPDGVRVNNDEGVPQGGLNCSL